MRGKVIDLELLLSRAGAGTVRADEKEPFFSTKRRGDSNRFTKPIEFVTTAHADVLTIIDQVLSLFVLERTGSASQPGPRLKE